MAANRLTHHRIDAVTVGIIDFLVPGEIRAFSWPGPSAPGTPPVDVRMMFASDNAGAPLT